MCGSIVEDSGSSWSAVYLSGSLDAGPTIAALGFVALAGMQFVGRIVGDRLVDRFGQLAVARTGGAITATGMGLALAFPSIPGTIIGFGAAGFGIATLIPAAMQAADELPGFRAGTGLTLLSWMMRLGFLLALSRGLSSRWASRSGTACKAPRLNSCRRWPHLLPSTREVYQPMAAHSARGRFPRAQQGRRPPVSPESMHFARA